MKIDVKKDQIVKLIYRIPFQMLRALSDTYETIQFTDKAGKSDEKHFVLTVKTEKDKNAFQKQILSDIAVNLFTKVATNKENIYTQFKQAVLKDLSVQEEQGVDSFLFDEGFSVSKQAVNNMQENELVKALGLAFAYMYQGEEDASLLEEYSPSVYQFLKGVEKNKYSWKTVIDFSTDKTSATQWAESTFKELKNSLTKIQNNSVNYLKSSDNLTYLNNKLDAVRGNTESLETKKKVQAIDKALEKKDAKIKDDMYVYKNVSYEELAYPQDYFYDKGTKTIDWNKIKELGNNFQQLISYGFVGANLSQATVTEGSLPIVLKLKLPKGTSMIPVTEDQVILPRNQGIEITKNEIGTINGKTVIKLEGRLGDIAEIREKIKAKVATVENQINNKFKELIPIGGKLVNLDLEAFDTSNIVKKSETLIEQLISNVPNELVIDTLKLMNRSGAFTFTDRPLKQYDKSVPKKTLGLYNPDWKQLLVQINNIYHITGKVDPTITIIHEFGHAVDFLTFGAISTRKEFADIYEEEEKNIKIEPYIRTNSSEFFAGVFSYMYSPDPKEREQIQKEAPRAYEFIKNLVRSYKL